MFVVKPYIHFNNKRNYHKKRNFFKRYDTNYYTYRNGQNHDLRLILARHAERIDGTSLGNTWYEQIFGSGPLVSPESYRHPMLPRRLPLRLYTSLYEFDPPLTRAGEQASISHGQQLSKFGINIDYCYSSPACRSVITADAILRGMNRSHAPIALEPYLFEPMAWNKQLKSLGDASPFMSTTDWIRTGFNIDRNYQRLNDYLSTSETENEFFMRSQTFFESIEQRHSDSASTGSRGRPSTILIVGHAATPLIFPTIALDQTFDSVQLGQQCGNIPFLHTVILERNATNRTWQIIPMAKFVSKL